MKSDILKIVIQIDIMPFYQTCNPQKAAKMKNRTIKLRHPHFHLLELPPPPHHLHYQTEDKIQHIFQRSRDPSHHYPLLGNVYRVNGFDVHLEQMENEIFSRHSLLPPPRISMKMAFSGIPSMPPTAIS